MELSDIRSSHRQQLEEISAQLIRFEANLRGKERDLQDTITRKDQVRIKRLKYSDAPE